MYPGMIILWYGAIVDIPNLWQLCDGSNGSPDLRDRFVLGAGLTYNPDDNGGNVNHNHYFFGDTHVHSFGTGTDVLGGPIRDRHVRWNFAHGTTDNANGLPPYHALAYLMRL